MKKKLKHLNLREAGVVERASSVDTLELHLDARCRFWGLELHVVRLHLVCQGERLDRPVGELHLDVFCAIVSGPEVMRDPVPVPDLQARDCLLSSQVNLDP